MSLGDKLLCLMPGRKVGGMDVFWNNKLPDQTSLVSGRLRVQIPAGPTLRAFKQLRRNCCLCNDICKQLDFLVFLDNNQKP